MRRNVVLPQPLGPTTEMNSPCSTSRSIPRRASRSPNHLLRCETASLGGISVRASTARALPSSQPKPAVMTMPAKARMTTPANNSGMLKASAASTDEAAKTGARAEQFRHHYANQAAADTELQPSKNERHRRRQRHFDEDLPATWRRKLRSISISRSLVVRSPASVLIVTGKGRGR